jgi:hypothetical protein
MAADITVSTDFAAIVSVRATAFDLNTKTLFNADHDDSAVSPIDQFFENTLSLTRLWAVQSPGFEYRPEVGILLLLGYVSAVESYMRALIRRVVAVDSYSQAHCEKQQLSFAAAMHHKSAMLPEALLEETVFSGKKEIIAAVTKFLAIKLEQKGTLELLTQYDAVCELRHCCVHRFGKLGTKNAISLGLQEHKEFLEKPIRLSIENISAIADMLLTVVRSLNNDIFKAILDRTATTRLGGRDSLGLGWTWQKHRDRRMYQTYYSIFASLKDAQPSPAADELYERFRMVFRKVKVKA